MKSVLGLNILLENFSVAFHWRPEFKPSTQITTKPQELKHFKIIAVHELQPHDPASRENFCIWILLSVCDAETAPHLMNVNFLW
jgi:hypothetical protein